MRLRPMSVLLLAVLLVAASLPSKLDAQTTTSGGLTGVVTDPSHAVVPDAGVEIRDNVKGTTQSTKTDQKGVYRFFFLSPDRYALSVTHEGFRKETRIVNVRLGPPLTANVTLELLKVDTTVTVTGWARLGPACQLLRTALCTSNPAWPFHTSRGFRSRAGWRSQKPQSSARQKLNQNPFGHGKNAMKMKNMTLLAVLFVR